MPFGTVSSSQAVPSAAGAPAWQPVAAAQVSVPSQTTPLSQTGGAPSVHTPDWQVESQKSESPPSQAVPSSTKPSAGQLMLVPSHVSATSHSPAEARHSTPEAAGPVPQVPSAGVHTPMVQLGRSSKPEQSTATTSLHTPV